MDQLRDYASRIIEHLKSERKISQSGSYYVHFFGLVLSHEGLIDAHEQLTRLHLRLTDGPVFTPEPEVTSFAQVPVRRVNWRILPDPSNLSADEFIQLLLEHFAANGIDSTEFDLRRIRALLALKPVQVAIGTGGFSGYYACVFANDRVLFESPVRGNAAYVVHGDWLLLSQQTKRRLQNLGSRIVHSGYDWAEKIRHALAL